LGYAPDTLLDYVGAVLDGGQEVLTVVKANLADFHPHLRLLLHLRGTIAGRKPFR
jgi:hypothetical protein